MSSAMWCVQVERLVAEAARMGFRRIILPAISVKGKQQSLQEQFQGSIQIIPCRTVAQAIYAALG
jgi:predicted ATP-dependent serine protease